MITKKEFHRISLMNASIFGQLKAVKYLIEIENADINDRDIEGETALYWARTNGEQEVIEYLKSNGAIE